MDTLQRVIQLNDARISAMKMQPDTHFPLIGNAENVAEGLRISFVVPASHVKSSLLNGINLHSDELQALAENAIEKIESQKDSK